MNKKKKPTKLKATSCSTCGMTQHDVPTEVEEKRKIKSKDVFEQPKSNVSKKSQSSRPKVKKVKKTTVSTY